MYTILGSLEIIVQQLCIYIRYSAMSVCPSVCPDERWDLGNYES